MAIYGYGHYGVPIPGPHGNRPYDHIDSQKGPYDPVEKDSMERLKEIHGK